MATIKGKWVFKDVIIDYGDGAGTHSINFTSNGVQHSSMNLYYQGFGYNINYDSTVVMSGASDSSHGSWVLEAYRTVDFGTTEQTVSDTFLTWMQANAIPEAEPTPTDAVTIEYNGAVIASLKAGQSATLHCKDKPMLADVVVTVPEGMGAGEVVEEWDGSIEVV